MNSNILKYEWRELSDNGYECEFSRAITTNGERIRVSTS